MDKKQYNKEYYKKNKERINKQREEPGIKKHRIEWLKKYRQRSKVKLKRIEYNQKLEVKEKARERSKRNQQRPEVKKKRIKYMKEWRKRPDIKEMKKESWKEYSTKNKEKLKEYRRNPKVKARRKNYLSNRLKLDNDFKLKILLRARLGHAFKSYSKNGKQKLSKEYGINFTAIIEYLRPFPKDIENYEIDHIIPLSWFDFNNPKEIKWAFSPENHQWLTKEENRKKNNKYILIK